MGVRGEERLCRGERAEADLIPISRVAGIRLTVDRSWFIIFLLVTYALATGFLGQRLPDTPATMRWILGATFSLALFASVLLHEFAHAIVARVREVEVDEIMLFIFGGVAKLRGEPRDPTSDFLIAAAGPVMSVALGAGVLLFAALLPQGFSPGLLAGLHWLGAINIALAIFNLIPGFPLDGGRILRAALWWRMDDYERATIAAARTGKAIAGLLMVTGAMLFVATGDPSWIWEVLIGWFLWTAANRGIRMARLRDAVEGVLVRDFMTDRVASVRADHDVRVAAAQTAGMSEAQQVAIVERDGTLLGVATIETILDAAGTHPEREVRSIARPPVIDQLVGPDARGENVISRIARIEGDLLLVVDDGKLIGAVDPGSLLNALEERRNRPSA